MRFALPFLLALFISVRALGVEPDEMLADPVLEARAAALERELRCVICQGESIAESRADIAKEMRVVLRERLTAGESDKEAIAYLVARYGDYVLLRPPLQANTLALWLFPALVLAAGVAGAFIYLRRPRAAPVQPLSPEEKKALDALLACGSDAPGTK